MAFYIVLRNQDLNVLLIFAQKTSKYGREKVILSTFSAHLGTAPACRSEFEQ